MSSRHSQRGIRLGYKKVDGIQPARNTKVEPKGWVDAGPNWKPGKRRKPRSPRLRLVDDLDEITSLIIRARDKQCVQRADGNCKGILTNGHVLPGRYHILRWDIRPDGQCHAQCWGHNYKHTFHQADYYDWYITEYGLERFRALKLEYYGNQGHRFSDKQLKEKLLYLREYYEQMRKAS